ncbi:hypothetical protein [Thiorhodococcus drewsii]|uniref:hypothetical protein n=1 Tax=Thiorhodococcus drewsii TaxID=210408 RepID=UPI0005952940|nr:hypothetical protein [Thiorhodococcus drewsii]
MFPLGRLMGTPRALGILADQDITPESLLQRHAQGDWGDLDPADQEANRTALQTGKRVFSSYRIRDGSKVWIITEADRSLTTVLMPDEY